MHTAIRKHLNLLRKICIWSHHELILSGMLNWSVFYCEVLTSQFVLKARASPLETNAKSIGRHNQYGMHLRKLSSLSHMILHTHHTEKQIWHEFCCPERQRRSLACPPEEKWKKSGNCNSDCNFRLIKRQSNIFCTALLLGYLTAKCYSGHFLLTRHE